MNNKSSSEKYNIIFIFLLFVIPLISLNAGFYRLSNITKEWALKEQEKKAIQEAETLSSEADFGLRTESLLADFFEKIKTVSEEIDFKKDSLLAKHLEKIENRVFSKPFPQHHIYVFKITPQTSKTELLFYKGDIKSGKRSLCLAFEHLYNLNNDIKIDDVKKKNNESFAKLILGDNANILSVAKDLRGISTFSKGIHKSSRFIWDYAVIKGKGIIGAFLICNDVNNQAYYGRRLALKNLYKRDKLVGAFLPVYKDYGEACIPEPLVRSKTFLNWSNSITIQNKDEMERWFKESLPQRVPLGNYTGFCHLGRGATHIAVVLVKSIKGFVMPKWLITINIFSLLMLFLILGFGIFFNKWPQTTLTTRFALSYVLASVLPLSLIVVSAYDYMRKYTKTIVDQSSSDLLTALKSFDYQKSLSLKKYKMAFTKALNDNIFIDLIKEKGIEDESVAQRVKDIFENSDEELPILGVKILDEVGDGAFLNGSASSTSSSTLLIKSIISSQVNILRDKLVKDNPEAKNTMREYLSSQEDNLDSSAFESFTGHSLNKSINKSYSVPVARKNGNSASIYQIFDFVRIDGKVKYMLFVVWDDKSIDDKIIQSAFDNYIFKYKKQSFKPSFAAYRIKGQSLEDLGRKTRHASKIFLNKITEIAMHTITSKKTDDYILEDNLIVAMPAVNFNQTVLVGWISIFGIVVDIAKRVIIFVLLIVFSFYVLWLCSKRSASVFLKPVSALKNALDEVSSGNLKVAFKNQSKDELGNLSFEFSKMIDGLIEKERLSKIISDQALKAIEKNSNGLLNDTESFKGVALVSDIRNFTGTSEKYEPTMITDLLNEHFAEMTKIISENGGLIYKYIGDAIEAVFPDNTDYKENALERAFKAGCMMISKLSSINMRREKIGLFPYKIGVGLCYGMMHSGSVGSLETRLDYAILGDPLKNAAKYEALSVQNPDFPIVFGEDIAKEIVKYGFTNISIDSKGQGFDVYSIDNISKANNEVRKLLNHESETKEVDKEESENYSVFSLLSENETGKINFNIWLNILIIILVIVVIFLGSNALLATKLDSYKIESDKECQRLLEQLKCEDVRKSAFETLCFDHSEDIYKALSANEKSKNKKQIIKDIFTDYEKSGRPIPYYCCCLYKEDSFELDETISSGFSPDSCQKIASLAYVLKRAKTDSVDSGIIDCVKNLMGENTDHYHIRSSHYRRSALATIEDKDMYVFTEKIFDKKHEKILAYILYGMLEESDDFYMPKYYASLAKNHMMLALHNKENWYFSDNFTEDEQVYIKNNYNNKGLIEEKGYLFDSINIGKDSYDCYLISTELASNYCSQTQFNIYLFLFILSIIVVFGYFIRKSFELWGTTVAVKLRTDIISSAVLPLLTFLFVSFLYVNEDSLIKESELRSNLNKSMDELEEIDWYYQPLCETELRKLSRSKKIQDYVKEANDSENEEKRKETLENFRLYLKDNVLDTRFKRKYFGAINPFFLVAEILVVGKNDWIVGVYREKEDKEADNKQGKNHISPFAEIMAKVGKRFFLNKRKSASDKIDVNETKDDIIGEKVIEAYGSMFGSDFAHKIIYFTDNLFCISVTFTSAGIYIVPLPSLDNPDYVMFVFLFFENEIKPHICNIKNDIYPYKQHIASNGIGTHTYTFYSPNMNVGEYFFYDYGNASFNYNNRREDLKTVKEFGLVSSWINTSYLPVSRKLDLYGPHLLEARRGNIVPDNLYMALGSEIPLKHNAVAELQKYGLIMLLSVILIFFIAQSIIWDLLEPIKQLINGARQAAKGNYKYRTCFSRNDELGILCNSFDKMMKGLEEKQLMNSMVSKSALKVTSKSADIQSKKTDVVLLYVTVPGFDKIMKSLPSGELFMKLKEQIAIIADIVTKNGGDIDKIMGEKMLIAFHLGNRTPKEVAVTASKVAHLVESESRLHFKVAVGVNYGQVISGYLGVGQKRDFTIIGDPVNVAARIASFAEKLDSNRCIVSEGVMSLIEEEIKTEEYGEVLFKGKALPAKVYRII